MGGEEYVKTSIRYFLNTSSTRTQSFDPLTLHNYSKLNLKTIVLNFHTNFQPSNSILWGCGDWHNIT